MAIKTQESVIGFSHWTCFYYFAMLSYVSSEFNVALCESERAWYLIPRIYMFCFLFSFPAKTKQTNVFFVLYLSAGVRLTSHQIWNPYTGWLAQRVYWWRKKNERTRATRWVLSRWLVCKNCKTYLCNVLCAALHASVIVSHSPAQLKMFQSFDVSQHTKQWRTFMRFCSLLGTMKNKSQQQKKLVPRLGQQQCKQTGLSHRVAAPFPCVQFFPHIPTQFAFWHEISRNTFINGPRAVCQQHMLWPW